MPQFLLELFSEEIPARMQKRGAEDLKKLLMDALTRSGFMPTGIATFSAPRRLTAVVEGLPARTPDISEERKGPKVGSPEQALAGFLRGAGLTDISQARIVVDAKKGDYYVADIVKAGQATPDAIAAIIPDIVRNFPWPKSMRWGEGSLRWVRPLHGIVAVFDGEIVPFDVDGITASNVTEGHRFHGKGRFTVRNFDDYEAKLSAAHVVLDRDTRKQIIAADARTLCQARNLELVEDEGLLEEVCGLVDEPHVIMGDMDPAFLDLPPEVIRLTLRVNQKYFVVRDPKTGALAAHFIVVSNVATTDGGVLIAQGNARVLAARLNDARYFWDLDRRVALDDEAREEKLGRLVFHESLGSYLDKTRRMRTIVVPLANALGFRTVFDEPNLGDIVHSPQELFAERAVELCKADLTTEMVGEFPELQGIMGSYYAKHGDEPATVASAIRDHYKPVGPSDNVPTEPVSIIAALADKIDTLVGFFAIGEKPTGSGDPYALRRSALGVIRIIIENKLKAFDLFEVLDGLWLENTGHFELNVQHRYHRTILITESEKQAIFFEVNEGGIEHTVRDPNFDTVADDIFGRELPKVDYGEIGLNLRTYVIPHQLGLQDLKIFFQDRLKVELRRCGYSAEHIELYLNGQWGTKLGYASEVLDCLKTELTPLVHEGLTAVARRTWNILEKTRASLTNEEIDTWINGQNWDEDTKSAPLVAYNATKKYYREAGRPIDAAFWEVVEADLVKRNFNARKMIVVRGEEYSFANMLASANWVSHSSGELALGKTYEHLQTKVSDALGDAANFGVALKALVQFEQPLASYFEDVFVDEPGKRMDRMVHLAKAFNLISLVGDFR